MDKFDRKNEEELQEVPVIILSDDNDKEIEFYLIAQFEYKSKEYVCLEPVHKLDGFKKGDLLILELAANEEGDSVFNTIGDDKLIDEVFQEFLKLHEQDCCCEGEHTDGYCDCEPEEESSEED